MTTNTPRSLTSCIALLLWLLACGPPASSEPFAPDQCYALVRGRWVPPIAPAEDSIFHRTPPGFRLTGDTVSTGVSVVWPSIVVEPWEYQVGSWFQSREGELMIVWRGKFTGVGIRLRAESDSLIGEATLRTDNGLSSYRDARASAAAHRTKCDAIDSVWMGRTGPPGA
jgi:hypothetical protein